MEPKFLKSKIWHLASIFLVSSICYLASTSAIHAATYYISPTGSDTNSGTLNQPWKTIQKAALTLVAGDTAQIRAGTYNERIVPANSGTLGNLITYSAYPGETVVIDGNGITLPTDQRGLIFMYNKKFLKFSNLTIQNSGYIGFYALGTQYTVDKSSNIELSNLKVLNSRDAAIKFVNSGQIVVKDSYTKESGSSGIGIWSSSEAIVSGNTVVNARNITLEQGGHEESISIASTTNFEVSNNDVSLDGGIGYLGNEGIDIKESSRYGKVHHNRIHDFPNEGGALYLDAWTAGLNSRPSLSNIDVYANHLWNAEGVVVGSERGGTAENINIYNNLIVNTGATGIGISNTGIANAPDGNGSRKNINIYNNTIYKARWNGGAGIYLISDNIENIVIRNNLIYFNNHNGEITAAINTILPKITVDHNLVFGSKLCSLVFPNCVEISNVNDPINYPNIHDNYTADPKFVSTSSLDLHLLSNSPAINSGADLSSLNLVEDFDSRPRPQGSGYDIGAFELTISTPTATPSSTPWPTNPGDANGDGHVDGIDFVVWLNHYNQSVSGPSVGDFDSNNIVDGVDYVIWLKHYGT